MYCWSCATAELLVFPADKQRMLDVRCGWCDALFDDRRLQACFRGSQSVVVFLMSRLASPTLSDRLSQTTYMQCIRPTGDCFHSDHLSLSTRTVRLRRSKFSNELSRNTTLVSFGRNLTRTVNPWLRHISICLDDVTSWKPRILLSAVALQLYGCTADLSKITVIYLPPRGDRFYYWSLLSFSVSVLREKTSTANVKLAE